MSFLVSRAPRHETARVPAIGSDEVAVPAGGSANSKNLVSFCSHDSRSPDPVKFRYSLRYGQGPDPKHHKRDDGWLS
jgi:hypothetical protein